MGLKGDFDEVGKAWRNYPWRLRLWLVLSGVIASNSIATLSDTVFRWKSFLKEGLSYYQTFIAAPVRSAIVHLLPSVQVPPGAAHLLILSALYVGANIRIAFFALPSSQARKIALQSTATYVGSCGGMLLALYWAGKALDTETSLGFFVGASACASFSYFRNRGAARILWFTHLGAPFALVGLLAAINSGLARQQ